MVLSRMCIVQTFSQRSNIIEATHAIVIKSNCVAAAVMQVDECGALVETFP